MKTLYDETECYRQGMLDVGDGNSIRWQLAGNPLGVPVVLLHGGPGSASSPSARRFFNPARYSIVQFDQRGCGGSLPDAGDIRTDLAVNTTHHLIADIERLRTLLGIARWAVFGTSWGCTLALAYAERHPERVTGLVLSGVTMTRQSEIDWLYRGMAPLFPHEWSRFRLGVPEGGRGDLVAAYRRLLTDPDPDVRARAAADWHAWEGAPILLDEGATLPRRWAEPRYLMTRARIITHYFHHRAWLRDNQLLDEIDRIRAIPAAMIHGRLDLEAPLSTAWELSRAWPEAQLTVVPRSAHSPATPEMAAAIISATDALLDRI